MPAEIKAKLSLQDGFSSTLKKTESSLKRFSSGAISSFGGISRAVFSLKGAIVGIAAAVTAGAFAKMVKGFADTADAAGKFADRIGVSVEFLTRMDFAAEKSKVKMEALRTSLQRLQRRIGEIRTTGKGEALVPLTDLGVIDDVKAGAGVEQVFTKIAEALSKIEDPGRRAFYAMKLFDTEGVALVPLMLQGAAGIEKLWRQADKLGLTLNRQATDAAAEFNSALIDLSGAIQGLKNQAIAPLLPELTKFIESFTNWSVENRAGIIQFFRDLVGEVKLLAYEINALAPLAGKTPSPALLSESTLRAREKELQDALSSGRISVTGVPGPIAITDSQRDKFAAELAGIRAQLGKIDAGLQTNLAELNGRERVRDGFNFGLDPSKIRGAAGGIFTQPTTEAIDDQVEAEKALEDQTKKTQKATDEFKTSLGLLTTLQFTISGGIANTLVALGQSANSANAALRALGQQIGTAFVQSGVSQVVGPIVSGLAGLLPSFAGGGIMPRTGPAMLHGTPSNPEAVIQTRGGVVPVQLTGGSGGETINVTVYAMDAQSFDEALLSGVFRNRAVVAGLVDEARYRSRSLSSRRSA